MTFRVDGAWCRRAVAIDGGVWFETQHVIWLQAASCYADIRVPFHAGADERCFTGRSGWDGAQYRWTHRLDLEPGSPAADDTGQLSWEGDTLVERGMFATQEGPVGYEEAWVPLPDAGGAYTALESPEGAFVRVGEHAIGVSDRRSSGGGFAAAYWRRAVDGWRLAAGIGDATDLAGPVHLGAVDALPPGWVVVERGDLAAEPAPVSP